LLPDKVRPLSGFEHPDPHYRTNGPKTRREFLNLMRRTGGQAA